MNIINWTVRKSSPWVYTCSHISRRELRAGMPL